MPDTPDETPGREEQVLGNVQGYVRVLQWAVAGELGVASSAYGMHEFGGDGGARDALG